MSRNEQPLKILGKFTNEQINKWVLEKLELEPYIYGSDIGNPAIMKAYLKEKYNIEVPLEAFSAMTSASRIKNDILVSRVDLDYREVYSIRREEENKYRTEPFPYFNKDKK